LEDAERQLDESSELKSWAKNSLKGKQRRVIEKLASNCSVPLADLAVLLEWSDPYANSWNTIRRELKKKLRAAKLPWVIETRSGSACLRKIGQK
jgi:hypothetical protein